jgi:hypothetical protein
MHPLYALFRPAAALKILDPAQASTSFYLFGDLWLESPALYLDQDGLAKLKSLRRHLEQLDT